MKWEVERVGSVERKLTVELEASFVDAELSAAYREVGKKAVIKGFRKGKAPKGLLKRQFGPQVALDVAENLVQKHIENAFAEADIEPVGNVSIDRGQVVENTPFSFVVSFDVMPMPENLDVKGIKVEWPEEEPSPADVASRLKELQTMKAELIPVEGRGSALGDTLNVSMEATCEGEVLAGTQADQQDIELDVERLLPGLAEGMVGLQDGDKKDVNISFPDDFADPNLQGKEAVFSITVHSIKTPELPELDDEFAKDLGLESLEELEEKVTEELRRTKSDEGQRQVRDSLFDQLIEKNPLEIPESLVAMRTREMMSMFFQNLEKQGISPQSLGERLPEQMEHFKTQAQRLCQERALTKAIIEVADISISDADLKERVETMMGDVPEEQKDAIIEGFLQGESKQRLKSQVEYEKVLEHVVGPKPEAKAVKKAKKPAGEKKTAAKSGKGKKKGTAAAEKDSKGKKASAKKAAGKKSEEKE